MTRPRSALLIGALLLAPGCMSGSAAPAADALPEPESTTSVRGPHAVQVDPVTPAPEYPPAQPGRLPLVRGAVVQGRVGPDGNPFEVALRTVDAPHARSFGTRTLTVALRTEAATLTQHPCTSCHAGSRVTLRDDRIEDAHADVRMTHPAETGATCSTCHSAQDVELLALRNGESATLDHAYRVCAQCHFPQADAWAAGAHGKRLDGWQGRRVVMGCTDCHDPHAPGIRQRLPFRPPSLQRKGGRSHEP